MSWIATIRKAIELVKKVGPLIDSVIQFVEVAGPFLKQLIDMVKDLINSFGGAKDLVNEFAVPLAKKVRTNQVSFAKVKAGLIKWVREL